MMLSHAILEGAKLKPQGFGESPAVGLCAIDAAATALGMAIPRSSPALSALSSLMASPLARKCPECGTNYAHADLRRHDREGKAFPPLAMIIVCLNDIHRWSRERIADYVATLEHDDA